jgi:hypothetical protein
VHAALATITARQPNASTAIRSGAPASVAPPRPMKSATALAKAKLRAGIQWLASFSIETNATPPAAPISRPARVRHRHVGREREDQRAPRPVTAAPAASRRRGPPAVGDQAGRGSAPRRTRSSRTPRGCRARPAESWNSRESSCVITAGATRW